MTEEPSKALLSHGAGLEKAVPGIGDAVRLDWSKPPTVVALPDT
jgi:hypothetical protein